MRRLELSPRDIDIIVLSHGHWDHTTGMDGIALAHRRAVIGGFHLSGPFFEKVIAPTCDALATFSPDYLVPCHCTGWRAIHAIAARFPDTFIQNSVGTRFEFT